MEGDMCNMNNTADTTEYAKVAEHTTWQERVPFLRTGDVVTIHCRTGETARHAEVCLSNETQLITAGPRLLRRSDGTFPNADGMFHSAVTDVVLNSARGQADELEPLAASLKAGDVVRATFIHTGSSAVTLEGAVLTDEDDDALLVVEDEDGASLEIYYLTSYGRIADNLRALEVINPDEDTPEREDVTTATYPGAGTFWGLQHVTAGLSSKVGDLSGKVAKMQREGGYLPDSEHLWGGDRADLTAALHDVAEYLAMTCSEAGIDPEEVLRRSPNGSTLILPDTTDIGAWLDGLPIGATVVDMAVSDTKSDSGYWEATKVGADCFVSTADTEWSLSLMIDATGDYRLLVR